MASSGIACRCRATCSTCCAGRLATAIVAGPCHRRRSNRSPRSSASPSRSSPPPNSNGRRSPRRTCAGRDQSATGRRRRSPWRCGRQLTAGERFVYAYYGSVDKTAHERGFGEFYEAELRMADHIVATVLEVLPPGAVLLVTADHGQVEVGDRVLVPDPCSLGDGGDAVGRRSVPLVACRQGFGGRARQGGDRRLRRRRLDRHPGAGPRRALVRADACRARWPPASATSPSWPMQPVSFYDPLDAGAFPLVCRHGSLTSAEVRVPLLASMGAG